MSNIVIIGSGPAGVSAALYAARAGVQTTVLTKGPGALDRAELIQNYYGFAEPIAGAELERRGIEGAKAVGVEFVTTEAVGLTYTDKLTVETLAGDFPADAVILATGASRAAPRIPGLAGLEGHGVSYCATCDAFFYRGRDVAVLGSGEYALHEVQALLPVAHSVTLLTGGAPLTAQFPPEVAVRTEAVEAILGEERVTGVRLKDGGTLEVSGVFVALGVAGSTALARKLGAEVNGSRIVVDDHMQTSLPGLYAAGDCTGGLLQVAKAVYEGAVAGTEAAKALRKCPRQKKDAVPCGTASFYCFAQLLQPDSSSMPVKSLASAILVVSNLPFSSLGATAGPASTGFTVVSSAAGFSSAVSSARAASTTGAAGAVSGSAGAFSKAGGHASPGAVSLASPSA